MPKYRRVALFLDYENLSSALQKRTRSTIHPYGYAPRLDFKALVEFIQFTYGALHKRDFIAVANFTHYDPQKGGLNQYATLVPVDSFDSRTTRQEQQTTPGKKHVVKDYADARLAYEIGQHSALHPADLYILGSNDKALVAVGRALIEAEIPVIFLLSNPDSAAVLIKENFDWIDFDHTQPADEPAPIIEAPPPQAVDPAESLVQVISTLRQVLSSPIPLMLIEALYGTKDANNLLQRAISQGRIDLWQDAEGISYLTLRAERLHDVIVRQAVRGDILIGSRELQVVREIHSQGLAEATGAYWRRRLKETGRFSARQAKTLYTRLQACGILTPGRLDQPNLTPATALLFLQQPSD